MFKHLKDILPIVVLLLIVLACWDFAIASNDWRNLESGNHSLSTINGSKRFLKRVNVRQRPGHVLLFNFDLAKKLGLMAVDAPNKLSGELEARILRAASLETTSDQTGETRIATYYSDGGLDYDSGKGDGRSIWLSEVKYFDAETNTERTFDLSAKGTGVTGLGYDEMPGHSDGLNQVSASLEEYVGGEILYRSGISDASRVLAVIGIDQERLLSDGKTKAAASILVRAQPTNLRFAHLWAHQNDTVALRELLTYHFSKNSEFQNLSFLNSLKLLLHQNAKNSAKELALLDLSLMGQMSPTRGNRLLNGQLIDYATLNIFDQNYAEFYEHRDLGKFSEQKTFALHWLKELKRILLKLEPTLQAVDVESKFENTYSQTAETLTLLRMGLTTRQAQELALQKPQLSKNIVKTVQSLTDLMTDRPVMLGRKSMKAPIIDVRKMLSSLPWMELAANDHKRVSDVESLLSEYQTEATKHADVDQIRIKQLLSNLREQLGQVLNALSKAEMRPGTAVATELQFLSSNRNSRFRLSGTDSRINRLKHLEQLSMTSKSPETLRSRLEEEIENGIDFALTTARLGAGGSAANAVDRKFIQADFSPAVKLDSIRMPVWVRNMVKEGKLPSELSSPNPDVMTIEAAEKLLKLIKLAAWNSPSSGTIKQLLENAFATRNVGQKIEIARTVIASFPQFLDFSQIRSQAAEHKVLSDESNNALLKAFQINLAGKLFRFDLSRSGDHYSIRAFDQQGQLVFRDGPRLKKAQASTGRVALHSSYLTTTTHSKFGAIGLYQAALGIYGQELPDVEVMSLISENEETIAFAARIETSIKQPEKRRLLVSNEVLKAYLQQLDISLPGFIDGEKESLMETQLALLALTLQGRTRIKQGWSFEPDPIFFGRFWSRRLDDVTRRSKMKAIQIFEDALIDGAVTRGIRLNRTSEFRALAVWVPLNYLKYIETKSVQSAGALESSCMSVF